MPAGRSAVFVATVTVVAFLGGLSTVPAANAEDLVSVTTTEAPTDDTDLTVAPATAPEAPATVTADGADESLRIRWSAPESNGGSAVSGYRVTATPVEADVASRAVTVGAATSAVGVSGLVNGVSYNVGVTATNTVGSSQPAAARATPRTVPGRPAIGEVTPHDGRVVVRWDRPASNGGARISSFIVRAAPTTTAVRVPGDVTSATVNGLENGAAKTFTVTAVNVAGQGAASDDSASATPRQLARLVVLRQPAGRVLYGTASRVRAGLRTVAGLGIPDQRVNLMARRAGTDRWRRVASGTTGRYGNVTLTDQLPASSALRLTHPAGAVAAANKDVRKVVVAKRVTASVQRTTARVGMTVAVRGRVRPNQQVGSVVRLQRRVDGKWVRAASGRMTTRDNYVIRWRPKRVGSYVLRVKRRGTAGLNAGHSSRWRHTINPESAADIARDILNDPGIELATVHLSTGRDGATARDNIVDVANGRRAQRSCHGYAPCGSTRISKSVLRAVRAMGQRGRVTISEFAGGAHASGSDHYSGRAVDITWVNGNHVGYGSNYAMAVNVCRANGSDQELYPSNDPWGGHSRHVHCGWN